TPVPGRLYRESCRASTMQLDQRLHCNQVAGLAGWWRARIPADPSTLSWTLMSETSEDAEREQKTVVVVGPDGRPVGTVQVDASQAEEGQGEDPSRLIEQPAKVMRIGSMIKQLLDEVKASPLDEKARERLTEIHRRSIVELESGLAPELMEELDRLALNFDQ